MTPTTASYETLERDFTAWALAQPAIRSAVVVGSRARPGELSRARPGPPDALSDLDLILFTTAPGDYAASPAWLGEFGALWLAVRHQTGGGDAEWLALYAGGFKADFVLAATPESGSLADRLRATPYRNVYRRGVRALFNHGGPADLPQDLLQAPLRQPDPPGAAGFEAEVWAALYAADRAARLLGRGDLWRAKQQVDGEMKQRLLTMLAWHARSRAEDAPQTWDDGRYLIRWAEPAAVTSLPGTFGAYAIEDLWRALWATLALYSRLARESAGRWGYAYPAETEARVLGWIRAVYDGRDRR